MTRQEEIMLLLLPLLQAAQATMGGNTPSMDLSSPGSQFRLSDGPAPENTEANGSGPRRRGRKVMA